MFFFKFRDLKEKIKIICKPNPIGNKIKTMSGAASNIMLKLEFYERTTFMQDKDQMPKLGATTATTLQLTEPYHSTRKHLIADSWFGLVKSETEFYKQGLFSIMLVKTAHKDFP